MDSDPTSKFLYEVVIFTSAFRNAGTTANVTIVLVGANGKVSEPHVISDREQNLLHRGAVDTFLLSSKEFLDKVKRVWLWHDNSGKQIARFIYLFYFVIIVFSYTIYIIYSIFKGQQLYTKPFKFVLKLLWHKKLCLIPISNWLFYNSLVEVSVCKHLFETILRIFAKD